MLQPVFPEICFGLASNAIVGLTVGYNVLNGVVSLIIDTNSHVPPSSSSSEEGLDVTGIDASSTFLATGVVDFDALHEAKMNATIAEIVITFFIKFIVVG